MREHNETLRDLREKLVRAAKVKAMLQSLRPQLAQLKQEEQQLATALAKEKNDVERLEKASLATFLYELINKKEEKLELERAEAYAAAMKHANAVRQAVAAEHEIQSLEAELRALSWVEMEYNRLLAEKAKQLKQENLALGEELCSMEERLGYIAAQKREIDEALSVGRDVLSRITAIEKSLGSAEGWGTWDLLGGGILTDLSKHSHLDHAQMLVYELQTQLRRYRTELADVTIQAEVQVGVEGFLRFADYFFDGLFADWAVLDSIHSAQRQIASTYSQVEQVQYRLGSIKAAMQQEENALHNRIQEAILNA